MPKALKKIDDGSQQQEWWHPCKRVCGLRSSSKRKLKIACGKIDGIVGRGRLNRAKGCNKNERWFATMRSTVSLQEEARHTIAQSGRKALDGRVAIGQEDELVHLIAAMGCAGQDKIWWRGNGMRWPR